MIRTQIYIPEILHLRLTRLAQERREPIAKIVRIFIEDGLQKTTAIDQSGKTALKNLFSLGFKGGPSDLSTNLDHYLYGGPKKSEAE
jgi:hypothetical protein